MKKVLITGGAGFIGSTLADSLLKRGDRVLVVDNYATGRRDNLEPRSGLEVVEGTIAERGLVDGLFERFRPDVVVHAAASYKDPENWEEDVRTNALGTAYVVQAAKRGGVARFIYFQTALCYGAHPLEQPITLTHPIRPESSYSISKTDDLIQVVVKAIDGAGKRGFYHISSGSDYAIKELFDLTLAALRMTLPEPVEVRPRGPDDVFSILLDPSKTNRDFEWKITTPLEEGIQRAIQYYQRFGIAETYTHLKPATT